MKSSRILLILFVGLTISACKTTKVGGTADCPSKEVDDLITVLKNKRQTNFEFFYGKIGMEVKDSKQSNSFKASIKMRPDSAFSGTIKVAGIIGAAFLVDQDTVAFTNKLKKCYKKESYNVLTEMFGADVDYDFMEALLLGQPIGLNLVGELYPLKDDRYYVLSSHDRKAVDRLDNSNLNDEEMMQLFVRYKLNCNDLTLAQILVDSPKDNVSITIDYVERQVVNEIDLPKETKIKIVSEEDSTFISMDYNEPTFNEPKKIRLNIPDSYSECE
jgi:hypothetical protein